MSTSRLTQRSLGAFMQTRKRDTSSSSLKSDATSSQAQGKKGSKRSAAAALHGVVQPQPKRQLTLPTAPPQQTTVAALLVVDLPRQEALQPTPSPPRASQPNTAAASSPLPQPTASPPASPSPPPSHAQISSPITITPSSPSSFHEPAPLLPSPPATSSAPLPSIDAAIFSPAKLSFLSKQRQERAAFLSHSSATPCSRPSSSTLPSAAPRPLPVLPSALSTPAPPSPVLPLRMWPPSHSIPLPSSLPVSFTLLLSLYSTLTSTLLLRSPPPPLSSLGHSLSLALHRPIGLQQLQQLAYLVPEAMGVEEVRTVDGWGRLEVDHKVTGGRGGVEEEELLQWRLRWLVKETHDGWLAGSKGDDRFDVTRGAWHPLFPLEDTPAVPRAEVTRSADVKAAQSLLEAVIARRHAGTPTPSTPSSSMSSGLEAASPFTADSSLALSSGESTPFTARGVYVEQFRRRALAEQISGVDRETPEQLQRLQHLGKLPQLLDLLH